MRYLRFAWCLLVVPVVLVGCKKIPPNSSSEGVALPTHEAVVANAVTSLRTTGDALNGVRDATAAEQTTTILERETKNMRQLYQRLKELGTASEAERSRVKTHSQELIDASNATKQAALNLFSKTQAGQFPRDISSRLVATTEQYAQAMIDFGNQAKPLFD